MDLIQIGWNQFHQDCFEQNAEDNQIPARVAIEQKSMYTVLTEYGEMRAFLSGKYLYKVKDSGDYPTVGDWVTLLPIMDEGKGMIQHLLPRKSKFSRKMATGYSDKTDEQTAVA